MALRRIDGVRVTVETRSVCTIRDGRYAYLAVLRDLTAEHAARAEGAKFPMQHSLDAFLALRSAAGEELILEKNMFVENIVVDGTQRRLTDAELNEYRRPFARVGEDRRPTLTWPREIPYEGTPADVDEIVSAYADWLPTSSVPKLFINADPGYILDDSARNWCRTWANQTEVTVPGKHFVQEDSPEEIAQAIIAWLQGLD